MPLPFQNLISLPPSHLTIVSFPCSLPPPAAVSHLAMHHFSSPSLYVSLPYPSYRAISAPMSRTSFPFYIYCLSSAYFQFPFASTLSCYLLLVAFSCLYAMLIIIIQGIPTRQL
ncbi:hypothetical protein BDQ17DRAFT_1431923 [Cyathus striatus]|nr:hypothetical protein BDQ17DRAFT_1431923 [Cyathus striatus]